MLENSAWALGIAGPVPAQNNPPRPRRPPLTSAGPSRPLERRAAPPPPPYWLAATPAPAAIGRARATFAFSLASGSVRMLNGTGSDSDGRRGGRTGSDWSKRLSEGRLIGQRAYDGTGGGARAGQRVFIGGDALGRKEREGNSFKPGEAGGALQGGAVGLRRARENRGRAGECQQGKPQGSRAEQERIWGEPGQPKGSRR